MGNSSSHKRTKAPNQARKDRPPDMDKTRHKQFFCHLRRKKPSAKTVLLFPLDQRQQLAEAAACPYARPGRPAEDALGAPMCSPVAAPMLRGAGDGVDGREGARAREMKRVLVLLLQLDARLQEEGRRAAGGPGGGACAMGGAEAPQGRQPLRAHLLSRREAGSRGDPREEQPRERRRCPRPRP